MLGEQFTVSSHFLPSASLLSLSGVTFVCQRSWFNSIGLFLPLLHVCLGILFNKLLPSSQCLEMVPLVFSVFIVSGYFLGCLIVVHGLRDKGFLPTLHVRMSTLSLLCCVSNAFVRGGWLQGMVASILGSLFYSIALSFGFSHLFGVRLPCSIYPTVLYTGRGPEKWPFPKAYNWLKF